ncbi:MAG: ribose-phosphate diphosphokinase [bacterium]|nr:ribose-phosphate diphosphokinase [bacterium]
MKPIIVLPTSSAKYLAKKLSRQTRNIKIIFPDLNRDKKRHFPDGEVYARIPESHSFRGKRIIVLHSGAPKPNEGLVELELILQILRDNKVRPEVFFAYFPYSMQDKVFEKGETNVAENLTEKLINFYRVKKIYIIDPHFKGRAWVKKYPIISLSAVPLLIEKAKKDLGNEDLVILSPDKGGKRRTKISGFKKQRLNSFDVKMSVSKVNLRGKAIGVVDDMIKTGGTLLKFCELAKKAKAKKVIALITHGVMPKGISRIKKNYSKLYLTNTIERKESNIDVTDLIVENIF